MPDPVRQPSLYDPARENGRHFQPGGLLDWAPARHWQREIERALARDHYGYQLPVTRRSGPEAEIGGRRFFTLSSYDYLDLGSHPAVIAAAREALDRAGSGTGGVRLLTGTHRLHLDLENALARFTGAEAAMTLTSGYMANLTPLTALFGKNDLLIADEKIHRSLAESCKLCGAELVFFRHNDTQHLEKILLEQPSARRKLVLTEGVFSMDGDHCPLAELVRLKKRYGAFLLVDEAHSLGVSGETGRGIHEHYGLTASEVDIWTGSLSKAIPANGGYVAGDAALILFLQHAGSPFFFSSALAPASAAAAMAALQVVENEPAIVAALHRNAQTLRHILQKNGFDTGASESAIVPLITGSSDAAHTLARQLYEAGFLATAVVFPAVPVGGARLRLCARAGWTGADLQRIERIFERAQAWVSPKISP